MSGWMSVCSVRLSVSGIIMISNVSNESPSSMLSSPGIYFDMDGAMGISEGDFQRKVQNLMF